MEDVLVYSPSDQQRLDGILHSLDSSDRKLCHAVSGYCPLVLDDYHFLSHSFWNVGADATFFVHQITMLQPHADMSGTVLRLSDLLLDAASV